jgi:hypothetical protein
MGKEQYNGDEKNIEDLLKKLSDFEYIEDKVAKDPIHVSTIATTIEQYLTPFITFGYDLNGDAVVISNVKTQRDMDSVMTAITRYLTYPVDTDIDTDQL